MNARIRTRVAILVTCYSYVGLRAGVRECGRVQWRTTV
jgi:hypothetical protein